MKLITTILLAFTIGIGAENVTYLLSTRTVQNLPFSTGQTFDTSKTTIFLIHGWQDNQTAEFNQILQPAIFKHYDVNIFVVDWSPIALLGYLDAANGVEAIGANVANVINNLIANDGLSPSNIILIGHSMGAEVAGIAGQLASSPLAHIIGSDPPKLPFDFRSASRRLDASDAVYVQTIQTDGAGVGSVAQNGDISFYPNGGLVQPGCSGCSHARAFQYLAEAIDAGTSNFVAKKCSDHLSYTLGLCNSNPTARMGQLFPDTSKTGRFYLNTHSAPPFAQG